MTTSGWAALGTALVIVASAFPSLALDKPETVKRVVVYKERKLMELIGAKEVLLRSYRVALGRNPDGPKKTAGDCRTPEGCYVIDRHQSRSKFYKSLHISYPNAFDLASARRLHQSPGGDVMIHGLPKGFEDMAEMHSEANWTKGCIAVNNQQMDEIFKMIPDGTPIEIRP
ncbi:MAG TPA: L,D-transpeptidase family protein [Geomonas sp.]|nr:L,D-transpeptidase family protein [Geomonas sp.]